MLEQSHLQWRSSNGVAWGLHLTLLCAEFVEYAGFLGFKWLFLDAEHSPLSHERCRELVRAADLLQMPVLVRVPEIKPSVIEGYLDVGVLGILAPNVSSAADAEALVAAVKFAPAGTRGAASRSRCANYGLTQSGMTYQQRANRATFTAALIESQAGIDQLEPILAVPGLDYVAVGTSDLALSMECLAGDAQLSVQAVIQHTRERLRVCGKPQLDVVTSAEQARNAVARGAALVAVSDLSLFAESARAFRGAVE
jgi:2-keto-3-deoxy-L-rhamnonate aldolase RhmA